MPNLSPQNLASVEIGKNFMLSHGYIKNDFDVQKWAAPEFLEKAARELLEEEWKKTNHGQAAQSGRAAEVIAAHRVVGGKSNCQRRPAQRGEGARSAARCPSSGRQSTKELRYD